MLPFLNINVVRRLEVRYLRSPFCKWVMPARLLSLVIVIYGFARIFAGIDAVGIALVLLGSLVWQVGAVLEERSTSFQLLRTRRVEELMRTRPIAVAGSWTLAKVRASFPEVDHGSFFVTMQDGSLSGIVLPESVYGVSSVQAAYQTMAVAAEPITFIGAVRRHDTVLVAFSLTERLRRNFLPVMDVGEKLVGVITRAQIADLLQHGSGPSYSTPEPAGAAA
jgi:hypothetical protein